MVTTTTSPRLPIDFVLGFPEIEFRYNELRNLVSRATTGGLPYDVVRLKDGDSYIVRLSVAGYRRDDITITSERDTLIVEGQIPQDRKLFSGTQDTQQSDSQLGVYEHNGISQRAFTKRFTLGEHMVVQDAALEDGILSIMIKRIVPEHLQPKKIVIGDAIPTLDLFKNKQLLQE